MSSEEVGELSPESVALTAMLLVRSKRRREAQKALQLAAARRRTNVQYLEVLELSGSLLSCLALLTRSRRRIQRGVDGWHGSAINEYVVHGDEETYRNKFRVTKKTFGIIRNLLTSAGFLRTNESYNPEYLQTSEFKLGVCLYFFAGRAKGDMEAVGDAGHIGRSTVFKYLDEFCDGVFQVLKPIYMPPEPPPPERVQAIRQQFAARRGVANVGMAVDGSHIPYVPQVERYRNDFKNYKGWMSILVVAFVNSFHFFVDAEVGATGNSGDSRVLGESWLLREVKNRRVAWLGEDGVIAADGGASDHGRLLLNPIPNATRDSDVYYNFCHSSTRFYVEETFGRWKNRFRFLLFPSDIEHKRMNRLIYASCILHNVCTFHADLAVDNSPTADDEWLDFFSRHERHACPSCVRENKLHCVHSARNRSSQPVGLLVVTQCKLLLKEASWSPNFCKCCLL